MATQHTDAPNHHCDHPGFSGLGGFLAAASMVFGRTGDASLAQRLSDLGPDDAVVDVGCGPGVAVRHAARIGASVVGIDPAPVMLRVARLLTKRSLKVRYLEGSAEALPLPDASASVAWSLAAVHHWAELDAGLRETRRVLRAGGRFVAIERHTQPGAQGLASHGWTDAQADALAQRCRDHGFTDVRVDRHQYGRRSTMSVTAIAA